MITNIFNLLDVYASKWNVVDSRKFTDEEIASISSAEVVPSKYGNSVCFTMIGGGQTFIPLSNTSSKTVGEPFNVKDAKLITLSKPGENDIYRVED